MFQSGFGAYREGFPALCSKTLQSAFHGVGVVLVPDGAVSWGKKQQSGSENAAGGVEEKYEGETALLEDIPSQKNERGQKGVQCIVLNKQLA